MRLLLCPINDINGQLLVCGDNQRVRFPCAAWPNQRGTISESVSGEFFEVRANLSEVRAYLPHIGARLECGACQTVNKRFDSIEPCVCLVKSLFDMVKARVHGSEALVHSLADFVQAFE